MQLYLNNSGHRWVNIVGSNNQRDKLTVHFPETGHTRQYAVTYWEAIGNFCVPTIRIKGKRKMLMESAKRDGQWVINCEVNRKNRE